MPLISRLLSTGGAFVATMFALCSTLRAAPLITEFMADNTSTLADEDGTFSDWIEIHNPDASPVNLGGWFLTDNASAPTKWPIPSVSIEPGGFLVIFASNKDRRVPGAELHTNFALAAGGEYLALIEPDGLTPASEYAPEYPAQDPDRSFGRAFNGIPLVAEGAAAQILVPSNGTLGTTWAGTGFTPGAGWFVGATGVGFGLQVPGLTIRDAKSSSPLNNLANMDALFAGTNLVSQTIVVRQTMNFLDDGGDGRFTNGNQVFPNGGGDDFATMATGTVIIPTSGNWTFGLNSDDGGRIRVDGVNLMVDDSLHGPQDAFGTRNLTAGPHTIEAAFFERGGGAEVELFAAPGSFTTFNTSFRLVGDTAGGGLAVFTTPDGSSGGGVIATDIGPQMRNINPGSYLRLPFSVADVSALDSLSLSMRFNDGFVAYLNGTRVASANAPVGTPSWNTTATAARPTTDAFVPINFNLTAHTGLLTNGANNVLALHGLNISSADDSFLALPELLGGGLLAGDPFYFDSPTPGGINGTPSSQGKVADTKFDPNRGFYDAPIQVAITSATEGAVIRYTTDGSKPTATTGTVYTAPIPVNQTTTLRAAAFRTGFDPTNVDTHTYLFLDDVIAQTSAPPPGWPASPVSGQVLVYGMNSTIVNHTNPDLGGVANVKESLQFVPTLSLVLDQASLTDANTGIYTHAGNRGLAWEREASMEMIFPPGYVDPDGNTEGFQSPCGLRIRGGFSRSGDNPKHSFRVFFRGDYGNGRLNYRLFGDEGADNFDKFDLRGPQNYSWAWFQDGNNSFMRDTWSRDLQGEMGQPYTRSRWYHLYLNGVYWGLCQTEERPEAAFGETYFGGEELDYDVVKSFGDVTDGNSASYQRLYAKWQAGFVSNADYFNVQGMNPDGTGNPAIERLVDIDNLIDYMIITYYTGDRDGPGSRFTQPSPNNYFGIYNRVNPDGFKFFEHDSEHSMGTGENNMVTPFTSSSTFAHFNPHTLHERFANDNLEYRTRFADRLARYAYNGGLLTDASGIARVNRRAAQLDRAIIAHSARWGYGSRTRNDWLNAVQGVRNFITGRVPVVVAQLRSVNWYPSMDPPAFTQHGGPISGSQGILIGGSPGTIYVTTDGSDPRLLGGGLAPSASIYQSSTINETLVAAGASWKYLADGSNQGTAWRSPGFNDAAWPQGNAELGYGDGDEVTVIPSGPAPNRYITSYFRRTFTATGVAGLSALNLEILRDDGAVVYLNGTEIARTNMPVGSINYLTLAPGVAGGADETTFYAFPVPTSALVEGTNVIAVEVHQQSGGSSDVSFNLRLTGVITQTATPLFLSPAGLHTVKARLRNGSEWSALTEATFLVDTAIASAANLAITEIHYHPSAPSVAEQDAGFNSRGDFEFIELTNMGPLLLDLGGIAFTDGIAFVFDASNPFRILAPGQSVILVSNLAAFELRYGSGYPVAGQYTGSLNNDGERITLVDAAQAPIRDFVYNDAAPWPSGADGPGYSLVLINPSASPDLNLPASWRHSSAIGGNPAGTDALDYLVWKADNGVGDDHSDDDGDGIGAFLEYVSGGDPNAATGVSLSTASVLPVNVGGVIDDYFILEVRKRIGADDVGVVGQSSDDLVTWPGLPVYIGSFANGDGTETLRFRSAQPAAADTRVFLRAQATLLP